VDPRVARTRRDVVVAASELLLSSGWDAVTHAEVARTAGYSKATVYAHWPTRLDLVKASIERICDEADHPPATGDLRADLRTSLVDFAVDLSEGHLDRLLAGVVERSGLGVVVDGLRQRLYDTGTSGLRAILSTHLRPDDVGPVLAQLTGAILVRVTFEGEAASEAYVDDLVRRVLAGTGALRD
jgi:AcrR family transcriptional regulator